jgi:hypothetical protein
VLADLHLPPGCTVRVELDPGKALAGATVTAFREGQWIGELSVSPTMLDKPGELQRVTDMLTKRGVRP